MNAEDCEACGAPLLAGQLCADRFHTLLALEFANRAYFTVHHLSVPGYLLQHNHYSRGGWLATRQLLRRFVHEQLTPEEARQQTRATVGDLQRSWRWTSGPKLATVEGIAWTRTIADVRLETVDDYCADVWVWARAVLADTREVQ